MNKETYLLVLRRNISMLSPSEIEDIIEDVASHFDFGQEEGLSEEEVARQLGDPFEMAQQFIQGRPYRQTQTAQVGGNILSLIIIGFGMLVGIPLVFAAYALLASLILTGGALVLSSVLLIFALLFQGVFSWISMIPLSPILVIILSVSVASAGIGLAWLSVIGIKALTHATRLMMKQLQRSFGGIS